MSSIDEIRAREQAATPGPWDEEWRHIPGYDHYQVSDCGHVRSYLKKGNHACKTGIHPRMLRLVDDGNGYKTVSLPTHKRGGYTHMRVHRLVMEAFRGPCPEGKEVAHLNGDKSDNRLANLSYVTHAENEWHKKLHGTDPTGEKNGQSKLLGWQVEEIKYLSSKSIPQGKIAELFDISHKQVSAILNGRTWGHTPVRDERVRRSEGA